MYCYLAFSAFSNCIMYVLPSGVIDDIVQRWANYSPRAAWV